MSQLGAPRRWLLSSVALAAAVAAALLVAYSTWSVIWTDMYRSLIQGLWLGLAGDLTNGVFYRPLVSDLGYGGTRYFPLHFAALAGVWKLGAGPLVAALIVQTAAAVILGTGMFAAARRIGMERPWALLVAAAALAPYFIQQSLHELRCDVLATGLNIWGLALVLKNKPGVFSKKTPGLFFTAALFTLAFATKLTSLAVPVSVAAGLIWSGDRARALRLTSLLAAGVVLVLGAIYILSAGRALENWQAAMFAGVGAEGTLDLLLSGAFVERVGYSRYLRVLVTLTIAALAATAWRREAWRADRELRVVATTFFGVTAATCLTLSSPGAMASNQAVEWIAVAMLLIASVATSAPSIGVPLSAALVVMTLWAAAQNVVQVRQFFGAASVAERPAERAHVIERTRAADGPVFSESAFWPVLTGRQPVVVDAFMLRVLTEGRPDIFQHLAARFDRKEFSLVILQRNPDTPRGREWFEDVTIGWPLMQHILANYRFEAQLAPDAWIYVRRE